MPPNNVQFDSDQQQFKSRTDMNPSHKSGLIGMFIKIGWAKDEAGANKLLYIVLASNIILIYIVIHYFL